MRIFSIYGCDTRKKEREENAVKNRMNDRNQRMSRDGKILRYRRPQRKDYVG